MSCRLYNNNIYHYQLAKLLTILLGCVWFSFLESASAKTKLEYQPNGWILKLLSRNNYFHVVQFL